MRSLEVSAYRTAFVDWLACAVGGRDESAARAARAVAEGIEGRVAAAATAGHVLDYDDTYLPGIAHLSAPTAPAALILGAELGVTVGNALDAYAAGFEAMGAIARAGHPTLYDRGWHPTSVCGTAGAAVAAARLLKLDEEAERAAVRLGLLAAGGLRASFGSDGKALQVGFAAAAGVRAARLADAGASASGAIDAAFETAYGGAFAEPQTDRTAISENWIKAFPCCLQTHGSIEAAQQLAARGAEPGEPVVVTVHPVSRQAASYDDVGDGLQAKFSIPYTVAFTLLHGPPRVVDFTAVDEEVRSAAKAVEVRTDPSLLESEAILRTSSGSTARIEAATGSPQRPMTEEALASKVHSLAQERLDGVPSDPSLPAAELASAAGI